MVELTISILILIVIFLVKLYTNFTNRKYINKLDSYLTTLNRFDIDLDTIKVEGFNWPETVPVDIYDTELDHYNSSFYGASGFMGFKGKYHKEKRITKYSTHILIPLTYKAIDYTLKTKLPIEHTILKMKFYMKKKTTVYVQNNDDMIDFIIDFDFLNKYGVSYITVSKKRY